MYRYRVTLADGRFIEVISDHPDKAMRQANHHETTRVAIAMLRQTPDAPPPASWPVSVERVYKNGRRPEEE